MSTVVYVTPKSLGAAALEATAATIASLHPAGGHRPRRASDGALILNAGRLVIDSDDPGFLCFAVEAQGYGTKAETAE